ncbi:hypothetical protein MBTS_13820, partial [Methylobacterium bullatum]|nr:hypothetical protein [Methylobacterium bullatum]
MSRRYAPLRRCRRTTTCSTSPRSHSRASPSPLPSRNRRSTSPRAARSISIRSPSTTTSPNRSPCRRHRWCVSPSRPA